MTTTKLIAYWPSSIARRVRKWWLRRQLAHIGYHLAHIERQELDNRHAKRWLQGKEALIKSDLRML